MKRYMLLAVILMAVTARGLHAAGTPPEREYYQLRIYLLENDGQQQRLDQFLSEAYLPALHRAGIGHIGVFKPVSDTGAKKVYVLVPYKALEDIQKVREQLAGDEEFLSKGKDYLKTAHDQPVYKRFENILLKAFSGMPRMALPELETPKSERVYELRSYESASEALHRNKVEMFNEGDEIGIFKRLVFNAVFYGEVLAGSHMPNLMYLTTFSDMASREAHWEAFRADAQWKTLSAMEKYQNNVSHQDILLLRPTDYSDI